MTSLTSQAITHLLDRAERAGELDRVRTRLSLTASREEMNTSNPQWTIRSLVEALSGRIDSQEDAVATIARRLVAAQHGLVTRRQRPLAAFLFVGPTGVGKTATAEAMSELFYRSADALVRVDMSEYTGTWATASLIGAKPGHVGYNETSGCLTTRVANNPRSVVLLDEIEKADPSVWNLLLQVLDAGHLTDSSGKKVSFTETIVVMTSNCGAREAAANRIGFVTTSDRSADIKASLARTFPPEFLGRLPEIITYDPLGHDALTRIARREIASVVTDQARRGRNLHLDDAAVATIVAAADQRYGARAIQQSLERCLYGLADVLDPSIVDYRLTAEAGTIRWTCAS